MAEDRSIHLPPMAYSINGLDRQANRRSEAGFVEALRLRPDSRCFLFHGERTPVTDAVPIPQTGPVPEDALFLGLDETAQAWFAALTGERDDLLDLRSIALATAAPPELLGRLAQARSLLHWHERHGFCANCGAATQIADAGYRRHCQGCGADHFPRTDPVIIIAVKHRGRLLLGRQAAWKEGMFSTLAGFMEPGETIEDAARREVQEESNIRLGEVRYLLNQPWPFPSSLMIGLIGEALNDDIIVDPKELQTARWFSHGDIKLMQAGLHPENLYVPPPIAIANRLITAAIGEI